jgi:hypothetical protein
LPPAATRIVPRRSSGRSAARVRATRFPNAWPRTKAGARCGSRQARRPAGGPGRRSPPYNRGVAVARLVARTGAARARWCECDLLRDRRGGMDRVQPLEAVLALAEAPGHRPCLKAVLTDKQQTHQVAEAGRQLHQPEAAPPAEPGSHRLRPAEPPPRPPHLYRSPALPKAGGSGEEGSPGWAKADPSRRRLATGVSYSAAGARAE